MKNWANLLFFPYSFEILRGWYIIWSLQHTHARLKHSFVSPQFNSEHELWRHSLYKETWIRNGFCIVSTCKAVSVSGFWRNLPSQSPSVLIHLHQDSSQSLLQLKSCMAWPWRNPSLRPCLKSSPQPSIKPTVHLHSLQIPPANTAEDKKLAEREWGGRGGINKAWSRPLIMPELKINRQRTAPWAPLLFARQAFYPFFYLPPPSTTPPPLTTLPSPLLPSPPPLPLTPAPSTNLAEEARRK